MIRTPRGSQTRRRCVIVNPPIRLRRMDGAPGTRRAAGIAEQARVGGRGMPNGAPPFAKQRMGSR